MLPTTEVKSRDRVFCDMICLLPEDMPEGEVKDMVKLDIHQLTVKRKYRASAQTMWKVKCKVITTIPSACFLLQIHTHIYLLVIPHQYSRPIPCYI